MMREHGMCQNAEKYYFDCLEKDYEGVPEEVLQHLNTCEHCQGQISILCAELKRQGSHPLKACHLHYELMDQWIICDQVKPFLALLAMTGQGVSMITPVTAHIDRCPDCATDYQTILDLGLSDAQLQDAACFLSGQAVEILDDHLKSTLEQIMARPASSVVTRTTMNTEVEIGTDDEIPLVIEQAEHVEKQIETAPQKTVIKPQKRHYYIGRIASMAAVLVLAAYLLLQPATVTGFGITDVYHAMGNVVNVCIKTMIPENIEPVQTIWISKSMNKLLLENQGRTVLWDMDNHSRRINGVLQENTVPITPEMFEVPWGLLPFRKISELPKGYTWSQVESIQQLDGKPVLVYDYAWQDGDAGVFIQRKWRGYLDPESKLPYKIEWWEKLPTDPQFRIVTTQLIEYPPNWQVEAQLNKAVQLVPSP